MIEVCGLSHGFTTNGATNDVKPILYDISFTLAKGSFVSLLGPSGCGKTTLLRIMDGLITPLVGEVRIDGTPVRKPTNKWAMVFQEFNLMPWRTAARNIEFALELHDVPRSERRGRAETALHSVGLKQFANYYPHQLSGGMKQRVGLARALSTNPSCLLMDEPFGALDPQIRELMQIDLLKLLEADRKTIVLVTHSIDEAIFLSDRIIVFSANPGRIINVIDIDLPRPRWNDDENIKASSKFIQYRQQIWHVLKEQIRKTEDQSHG